MSQLVRLLYTSVLSKNHSSEVIQEILEKGRASNARNGITGILLFRNGEFLQLLEGDMFNVYFTFKKIRDDERHYKIRILHESPIESRLFSSWTMAYKDEKTSIDFMNDEISHLIKSNGINSNLELSQVLSKFLFQKAVKNVFSA
jgi:hypothetical protein